MASAGSAKRKRKDVSLKTKYEALIELENGKTNKEVAESFGIPQNTVSTWKANKAKIVEAFQKGGTKVKRIKSDKFDQINTAVFLWFKQMRSENVPLNGVLIKEKALFFAKELGVENFQASDGWLGKWKSRLVY